MNQRTHAWIAIRATALLKDEGEVPGLVELLTPRLKAAAIGAWIPDKADAKLGGSDIDNHVLKMKPFNGDLKERFVVKKPALLKQLGKGREVYNLLDADTALDKSWWSEPYRADPPPGQHLANRAMALGVTITDLLILGDPKLAALVPGTVRFTAQMDGRTLTAAEQAAMHFFMLSHFVADACMPCHCDARVLAAYANGLHKEMEGQWSRKVGTYFEDNKLEATTDSSAAIMNESRAVDAQFGLKLNSKVPELVARDIWSEVMFMCRGAFAVASIIASPGQYDYDGKGKAPFKELFAGSVTRERLLEDVDRVVMHDAVMSVAMVWKHVWARFR